MSETEEDPKKMPVWKTIHLRGNREGCWAARDEFYKCVLEVQRLKMKHPFDSIDYSSCRDLRNYYRSVCPGTWVGILRMSLIELRHYIYTVVLSFPFRSKSLTDSIIINQAKMLKTRIFEIIIL